MITHRAAIAHVRARDVSTIRPTTDSNLDSITAHPQSTKP
jgi:hypothetical protein